MGDPAAAAVAIMQHAASNTAILPQHEALLHTQCLDDLLIKKGGSFTNRGCGWWVMVVVGEVGWLAGWLGG